MNAILLMFHVKSDTGYAMKSLVPIFVQMAEGLVKDKDKIHISFTVLNGNDPENVAGGCHIIELNPSSNERSQARFIKKYIKKHGIDVVFGFDQPVRQPCYRHLRSAGVKRIVSYWGAPMSDLNNGIKLFAKNIDVMLARSSPDHYIFESKAMAETAYLGRGVPKKKVSIVPLGVDVSIYKPYVGETWYAYDTFLIPRDRKIIYYAGHMEERKGVAVLVRAAKYLYETHNRRDYHFLILGNRKGEEQKFNDILGSDDVRKHVTFGGYRNDIERIIPSCYIGTIASTGWDSFTMSSLEMAACGLPLLVSNLQGLIETIEEGETGYLFKPGEYMELADNIIRLLDNPVEHQIMGKNARERIVNWFSTEVQVKNLLNVMSKAAKYD